MKSPTMKEVAQHAGVSVATVSRVLNGSTAVDGELHQRVMSVVEELRYRPNRLARNLRTNSTKTIAIVVPDIENPFFVSVVRGLEDAAFRAGYTVLVCNTDDDLERESSYLQVLGDEFVAGIVVCATDERYSASQVRKILEKGVAVVSLDRRLEDVPVDGVLSDNFGGTRNAVSYLVEQGHRRIGLIAGPAKYAPARERRAGYEQGLADHGLAVDPDLIKVTNFKSSEAETATKELLDSVRRPTALFLSSGNVAIGSLRAIHHLGLDIPSDLSLIVFDDLDWAPAYNPPLTVVAQNTRQLGGLAGDLMLRRIRGSSEPPHERHLPTQLIVRGSVGLPPQ
ncbi:MAG: LacI family DNA-binding transcriptional regulator [Chloroflexi bacterium]|nr:LacI family DNA-binding transcriptional regulator [Chloroflexota bacterium]